MPQLRFVLVVIASLLVSASGVSAQAGGNLKPYFLLIFDTSGSMQTCLLPGNDPNCFADDAPRNECGFPRTRLGEAQCAVQKIIDNTGDATFGLMQYAHPCRDSCIGLGGAGTAPKAETCDVQLLVEIQSNNAPSIASWVDGNCEGSCAGGWTNELTAEGYTPLGKSLQRAREYLRGEVPVGNAWPYLTGGNVAPASPLANDPYLACRTVSVILLTDGEEYCQDQPGYVSADTGAGQLFAGQATAGTPGSKSIKTYVIAFGTDFTASDLTAMRDIAAAGGNTNGGQPYRPLDGDALSTALTQIIADAQPPSETCNGMDDDCDMAVDEGFTLYCSDGNPDNATLCDSPGEMTCDGVDDDCDGIVDEGVKNACGVCGPLDDDLCDGIDNDCDRRTDEAATTGQVCGTDIGTCEAGELACIAGSEVCVGEIGPGTEACDCQDNDCDGNVDEDPDGSLCGDGTPCLGCECVPRCEPVSEFDVVCPQGLATMFLQSGECVCVQDNCDVAECAGELLMRDGKVGCAPDNLDVGECQCRGGTCVAPCDGVTCGGDEICDRRTGLCVEDNCRGLGCDGDTICNPGTGECVTDPCADAGCAAAEVCRGGTCEPSCVGVACAEGERCRRGQCEADPCATIACPSTEVCDPQKAACVASACTGMGCPSGQLCNPLTGACEAQPCWDVRCPSAQVCLRGECLPGGVSGPGKPSGPTGPTPRATQDQVSVGGGCGCRVAGPVAPHRGTGLAWGLPLLLLVARRRRLRIRRWALALAALGLSMWLMACSRDAYCIDCGSDRTPGGKPDAGSPAIGDGDGDGTPVGDGDGDGDATGDGDGDGDGDDPIRDCEPEPEVCDGFDNDCNLMADDGVTPETNDCNQRGVCAGTVPRCIGGSWTCRYEGDAYEQDETLCDDLDNDCDGKVDEGFDALGTACEVGVGACINSGRRVCDPSTKKTLVCDAAPKTADDEVCDGLDNDCDGLIDEPRSDPGSAPSYVQDAVVQLGAGLWIYQYEASRPDASADAPGRIQTRACSQAGVLPWTNLTRQEAAAACTAAGMRLCTVGEWIQACTAGGCEWSYAPACKSYPDAPARAVACNGHDMTATPGGEDVDALLPTGDLPDCYTDGGNGRVYDLSGNARELTTDPSTPSSYPVRGGAYDNLPGGLRCDADFTAVSDGVRLNNMGFRCCSSTAP